MTASLRLTCCRRESNPRSTEWEAQTMPLNHRDDKKNENRVMNFLAPQKIVVPDL